MMLLLFLVVTGVRGQCGKWPLPDPPKSPAADGMIVNPRDQKIITRKENSEIVDLGHPGPADDMGERKMCPHEEEGLEYWSDVVGRVSEGARVELPGNKKILLSSCSIDKPLGQLVIPTTSELIFADEPIHLSVTGIEVYGKLRAGGPMCRLRSESSITLHGSRPSDNLNGPWPGHKGIYAYHGGKIDIHAVEYYHTWSRLAVTAEPGDTMILLQDTVNWDVGMTIVVTTTHVKDSRDFHQNEIFTITKVRRASNLYDTTAVYLDGTMKFQHYGGPEYQAEVGLLSRRFKIKGDKKSSEPYDTSKTVCGNDNIGTYPCGDAYLTGYGGHVMIEGTYAEGRFSGVEFFRMGQTNFEGRYPIHYHLIYDGGEKSYVRDSSFHRSFYKCITLHGTNKVLVSRNVAYDITGSCLYLEDGVEENNVIEFNLHAHIHTIHPSSSVRQGAPPGEAQGLGDPKYLPDVYSSKDLTTPTDATASGFYISNAKNNVRGNAAVGGFSGFHFPVFATALGLHDANEWKKPMHKPPLEFDGNSCRSAGYWWSMGGCLYTGGWFRKSGSRKVYSPGRSDETLMPCKTEEYCWDYNDRAYLQITNLKVAATTVGFLNWGERSIVTNYEAHDLFQGPVAKFFGDNSVDNLLVTCETSNRQRHVCGGDAVPHNGDAQGYRSCGKWDERYRTRRRHFIEWYDTRMKTVYTNVKFRNCDPTQWTDCEGDCKDDSALIQAKTHSNRFLPEVMQMTGLVKFENSGDVRNHFIQEFSSRSSASGRHLAWIDPDGGICGLEKPWGPTLVGSNRDAGDWWKVSDECVRLGRYDELWCCKAPGILEAAMYFKWDDGLENQLIGNGGRYCENASDDDDAPCPRVGWLARFGQTDLERQGLKVAMRPEMVGPMPTRAAAKGFGWYLWLDRGAPGFLELSNLQIHHEGTFVMAIAYPKSTSGFDIKMESYGSGCGRDRLCAYYYRQAGSLKDLADASSRDPPTYYIDEKSSYKLLYVRVVVRSLPHSSSRSKYLSNDMSWDYGFKTYLWSNAYLESLPEKDYWGIPFFEDTPKVYISAKCSRSGAYCSGGPQPKTIPPLMWTQAPPPITLPPEPEPPLPEIDLAIDKFILYNLATASQITPIDNGKVILDGMPIEEDLVIRTRISGTLSDLGSVKYELNNQEYVVNEPPYEVSDMGRMVVDKKYTLRATPYTKEYAMGQAGTPLTVDFRLKPTVPEVTKLVLRNIETNAIVADLVEGDVVTHGFRRQLRIRALTAGPVKSVKFELNNQETVESTGPFEVAEDGKRVVYDKGYTLTATPYSEENGRGEEGETLMVKFMLRRATDVADVSITKFELRNTEQDEHIVELVDGEIFVDSTRRQNRICAQVDGGESVKFDLNGQESIDSEYPFEVAENQYRENRRKIDFDTEYTLTATPYMLKNGQGKMGNRQTITFILRKITPAPVATPIFPGPVIISGFTLVDTKSNTDVATLNGGDVYPPANFDPMSVTIRADVPEDANVASVRFYMHGFELTDSISPYQLYGEKKGVLMYDVTYTLTGTPYEFLYGGGMAGEAKTIQFTLRQT